MTSYLLPFEKMHGAGNDFVLLERRHLPNGVDHKALAKLLCNRNFGIGADGLIIMDLSSDAKVDFIWNFYNLDGSEAEMCGNGMRCFAKYVYERGFTDKNTFSVLTKAGIIKPTLEHDASVSVNMGTPVLPKKIKEELLIGDKKINYSYIEIGNPHCVIFNDEEISDSVFYDLGPIIEKHSSFPHGVNVEFAKVLNKNEIRCRVWERSAGPTLACGTGACATLVAANINNLCGTNASIHLPGGCLKINWNTAENNIYLNGPATSVFTGQFNLDPKVVCH
ncbi:MAG: diaminopimelate epimerase [Candidatus Melainabacteria bacterium]|nr:diaminopimelate epimerase [Candidatus Melainabacteria bacterium]